jgi:predicted ATPase
MARTAGLRVLLICTHRKDFDPSAERLQADAHIHLGRLGASEARKILENMLGGKAFSDKLMAEIVERTDQIPLFVEEITKDILESPFLIQEGDTYTLANDSDTAQVLPTTPLGSMLARLDRRDPERQVAPVAATIGRTFSYDLLREAVELDQANLDVILSELRESQILELAESTGRTVYRFSHALMQEAALETLLNEDRPRVHRRIAEAARDKLPDTPEASPEIPARHFFEAEMPQEARTYWCKAGEIARNRAAHFEASSYLELALGTLDTEPDADHRADMESGFASSFMCVRTRPFGDRPTYSTISAVCGSCTEVAAKPGTCWSCMASAAITWSADASPKPQRWR